MKTRYPSFEVRFTLHVSYSMKYLIAYALFNKQFTFFTGSTVFLQHGMCRLLHEQRNIAAMCRTYTYTAHAGDTDFLIHIFRILQINSLDRAGTCTDAAGITLSTRFGNDACFSPFSIGTIAGNMRYRCMRVCQFFFDLFSKTAQHCSIVFIRSPGGKLTVNGMFRNCGYCRSHLKSGLDRSVR